jgi:hypothetical protein
MNASQHGSVPVFPAQLRKRAEKVFFVHFAKHLFAKMPRNLLLFHRNGRILAGQVCMAGPAVDDAELQSALLEVHVKSAHDRIRRILKIDGDQIAYGGIEPYSPTNITLGLEAIRVTFAENGEDGITVGGTGFNSFSQVFLNGRKLETEFLDNNTLFCVGESLEYGDSVTVVQISSNFRKLSETAPYTYSRGFLD